MFKFVLFIFVYRGRDSEDSGVDSRIFVFCDLGFGFCFGCGVLVK